MTWLGARALKKYPTPVLKPMAPFFAAACADNSAGLVIAYGINSAQNAMMKCTSRKRGTPERTHTNVIYSRRVEERCPQPSRQEALSSQWSSLGYTGRRPSNGKRVEDIDPPTRFFHGRCIIDARLACN
ncbi:ATP synthase subunit J [Colletotrichum cuscutae]|uniref:ATP synthase subunit J n=1 Tax=Colletotrichum cuscutae TaxID=1209917 RepID=A0AAI9VEF4_9PEZI|nr:ATP synthase subunit J [Colletotrichum cuscutae]